MRTFRDYSVIALAGCVLLRVAAWLVAPVLPLLVVITAFAVAGTWLIERR